MYNHFGENDMRHFIIEIWNYKGDCYEQEEWVNG